MCQDEGRRQHHTRTATSRRSPFHPPLYDPISYIYTMDRSIIPSSSTSDMLSKTTKTVSLSSISCSAVTYAVCPLVLSCLPSSPSSIPTVHLDRLGTLSEEVVRFYVAQLSSALAFLHENHIMHRFVSPSPQLLFLAYTLLQRSQTRQHSP